MEWLEKIVGWIVVPMLAFFALVFIGNPYIRFRTLRNEISARLTEYDNVMAQYKQLQNENYQLVRLDLSESEQKRLAEAELTFRKLGSELSAVAENEGWLNWVLELCGYHPANASSGLIGLSNSIATYGANRHHFKKLVRSALKLPE